MLTILPDPLVRRSFTTSLLAGGLLGIAILAKGLVPLVLFLPALWFLRRRVRDLLLLLGSSLVIAGPWYALVTIRNGAPFLEEFFWKHHFGRFLTSALQHQQPIWFYVPVLLAGLFPWTPLLALLFTARCFKDRRNQFLLAWFAWGFLFFSVSRNKLPGYLLPLLPPVAALLGIAAADAQAQSSKIMILIGASAVLLSLIPPLETALPQVLVAGLSHTQLPLTTLWIIPGIILGVVCGYLEKIGRRNLAIAGVAALTAISVVTVLWRVYPELDRQVSARAIWRGSGPSVPCLPPMTRSRRYGIEYYAARNLPNCN
ncbi:MAG: hypothetical protein JOZ32_10965 [Bryobacterales bacterium]|nr:hypothetical protein [Bryobacterales bacterium]